MLSPEERIAELIAGDSTSNWHFSWLLTIAYRESHDRKHAVAAVRRQVLHKVGVALIEGYDGGELAPEPRNAAEHRVGDAWLGSVLLHEFDRLDGIEWWQVTELLTPLIRDCDRTPPLQRAANRITPDLGGHTKIETEVAA